MAQFYRCFIKNFTMIMAPIIKLTRKIETFLRTKECHKAQELIKQKYIETQILLSLNWQVEFHVHTNASLLIVGVMLFQNVTRKSDQPIVYVSKLLNRAEYNNSTIEKKALVMVSLCTSLDIICWAISFIFYVDHMALVYLVNKPQV